MTNTAKYELLKNRLNVLTSNGKNIKSPGIIKKLERQLRNMDIDH